MSKNQNPEQIARDNIDAMFEQAGWVVQSKEKLNSEKNRVFWKNPVSDDSPTMKAEALRQSILKKAFAGQLIPQDLNDEPASTLLARIRANNGNQQSNTKQTKLPL